MRGKKLTLTAMVVLAVAGAAWAQRPGILQPPGQAFRGWQVPAERFSSPPMPQRFALYPNAYIAAQRQRGPRPERPASRLGYAAGVSSILQPPSRTRVVFPFNPFYPFGFYNPWGFYGSPYGTFAAPYGFNSSYWGYPYSSSSGYDPQVGQAEYPCPYGRALETEEASTPPPAPSGTFSHKAWLTREVTVTLDGHKQPASISGSPLEIGSGQHTIQISPSPAAPKS